MVGLEVGGLYTKCRSRPPNLLRRTRLMIHKKLTMPHASPAFGAPIPAFPRKRGKGQEKN